MMPQFNDDEIEKISSKLNNKRKEKFVQDIKKLAESDSGREILRTIVESVREGMDKESGIKNKIKSLGGTLKNLGDDALEALNLKARKHVASGSDAGDNVLREGLGTTTTDVNQTLKNIGAATGLAGGAAGVVGGAAYGANKAYDQYMGQGAKPGNKRLEKVLQTVPELKDKYEMDEIQRTWHTIAEHAPRLANSDAITAAKILERMLDYEGVDIQAIDQIMDIEKKKRQERSANSLLSKENEANEEYIQSLPDKIDEVDNTEIDKEAANEEFNELKELVSEYDN